MIKPVAIAASAGLHASALATLIVAHGGVLPDVGSATVRLVVAVPLEMPGAASEASVAGPLAPERPEPTQPGGAAAPMPYDVPAKALPTPDATASPVPSPILTPARTFRPDATPTPALARPAAAASSPAADAAPARGQDQAPTMQGTAGTAGAIRPLTTPAVLLASVAPEYPADARRAGQEGRVVVKAFVDAAGTVARTAIEVSSGFAALDTAAAAAVSSYRFRPELRDGVAVASAILVPIRFSLTDGER